MKFKVFLWTAATAGMGTAHVVNVNRSKGGMNTYPQRVAENILPLSVAGSLPEAFKEWYFTENVEDYVVASEDCELCNHEELRYHFEIKNRHTNHCLWVGSSCILKFQVQVFENERLLDAKNSQRKLNKIKQKMRLDSCLMPQGSESTCRK